MQKSHTYTYASTVFRTQNRKMILLQHELFLMKGPVYVTNEVDLSNTVWKFSLDKLLRKICVVMTSSFNCMDFRMLERSSHSEGTGCLFIRT
jgi:hypothetical protein